jgi:hypothetical protein
MSYMKKIIVLVAALLLGWQANAQIVANGGFTAAFEKTKTSYGTYPSALFGVYAGANYYYSLDDLVDGLAVLPGANLSLLFGRHWFNSDVKVRELALNIPLQASYTYEVNENLKAFGQTGPTVQLALTHKAITPGATYNLLSNKNSFGEVRSPFNLYWGIAVGVEVSDMLRIETGYDFGFFRLSRTEGLKTSRGFLHFGVGYLF